MGITIQNINENVGVDKDHGS
ncbi:hypothetical protein IL54_3777 [Sphingobium sp. ba1]|nr:hypothetical protein IL54_3777 [Sphingobium sp. ba1]